MSCPSSFHGRIEEIPGIAVDNFKGDNMNSRAFFLSHYHRDHTQGLSSRKLVERLKSTKAFIYTSEITASIMNFELKHSEILNYVKPLGRDNPLITLPSMPDDDLEELFLDVTLIPAGHSFGSTMFLFKTSQKTVLYTGDFRIRINDLSKYGKLHKNNEPIRIDAVYVDTTFIDEKYEDFAKRTDTADTVIDEIDKWLKMNDRHSVSLFLPSNYTFEFLFNKIYERLKRKVYINNLKWKFYSKVQHLVPSVTNDPNESRIHLCQNKFKGRSHGNCMPKYSDDESFLHVHLTAMKWENYNVDNSPITVASTEVSEKRSDTSIDACFSTHCSRSEIHYFISYFNPPKVEGFPNTYIPPDVHSDDEFVLTPKTRMSSTKKRRGDSVHEESVKKLSKRF